MIGHLIGVQACILSLCAGGMALAASALAQDSAADALAGHRAEQRQWMGEQDPFRRPLFYDPVDIETAVVGLPCDHLLPRKPQSVAGEGFVVLLENGTSPPRRLRFFAAPGQAASLAEARNMARRFASARGAAEWREVAARAFAWCR